MNCWVTIYRLAGVLLIVLFAVGLICLFLPKYNKLRELQKERAELQKENRKLENQIKELAIKQERFNSDLTFVERTAREMDMIKPDETVFKFTNEQPQSASKSPH